MNKIEEAKKRLSESVERYTSNFTTVDEHIKEMSEILTSVDEIKSLSRSELKNLGKEAIRDYPLDWDKIMLNWSKNK